MSWPLAQGNALPSAVRFVTRSFPVSFSRPNSIASGEEPPERLYRHKPSVGVERGERGLSRPHLEFWGIPFMSTVTETRFRRAPWGRKKHLLPLPILSVVLLVTAMAAPGLLHMTVTVIDDPNLKFTATVQNVVHPSGPDGKIVGIMTVTNRASTD